MDRIGGWRLGGCPRDKEPLRGKAVLTTSLFWQEGSANVCRALASSSNVAVSDAACVCVSFLNKKLKSILSKTASPNETNALTLYLPLSAAQVQGLHAGVPVFPPHMPARCSGQPQCRRGRMMTLDHPSPQLAYSQRWFWKVLIILTVTKTSRI